MLFTDPQARGSGQHDRLLVYGELGARGVRSNVRCLHVPRHPGAPTSLHGVCILQHMSQGLETPQTAAKHRNSSVNFYMYMYI